MAAFVAMLTILIPPPSGGYVSSPSPSPPPGTDLPAPAESPPVSGAAERQVPEICREAWEWVKNNEEADTALYAFWTRMEHLNVPALLALRKGRLVPLRGTDCYRPENVPGDVWAVHLFVWSLGSDRTYPQGADLLICGRDGLLSWSLPEPYGGMGECVARLTPVWGGAAGR